MEQNREQQNQNLQQLKNINCQQEEKGIIYARIFLKKAPNVIQVFRQLDPNRDKILSFLLFGSAAYPNFVQDNKI